MDKLRKSVKYIPSVEVKQNFQKQFELMQEQFKEEIKKTKKESKQLGKREGIQIGEARLLKMMLTNGNSIKEIAKITNLSVTRIQELLEVEGLPI
jgi:predicted transposase/invertase (TIGR01784 family)